MAMRKITRQPCSLSQGSTASTSDADDFTSRSKAVWAIRIIFLLFLFVLAAALGFLAHHIIRRSEDGLGEQQYEALTARALDLGQVLAVRRRVVVKSMAQIAASAFPDSSAWPNVAIPAFQTFAEDMISTSDNMEIGFYPMVHPQDVEPGDPNEQASFEEFAYDYFYNKRSPPFPNDTAVHNFGRGIWKVQDVKGLTPKLRVRDTTGETQRWESPNKVLFPEIQHSNDGPRGRLFLLHNVHSVQSKGEPIDEVISCARKRKATNNRGMDCGVVTGITAWNRASFLIQPIYPAKDLFEVRFQLGYCTPLLLEAFILSATFLLSCSPQFKGVIMSRVSWDIIVARMFEGTVVTGLIAVLESDGRSYSYSINQGVAVFT